MDKKKHKSEMEFDYSTIPKFMQENGKFCLWKLEMKLGKAKPVVAMPSRWTDFSENQVLCVTSGTEFRVVQLMKFNLLMKMHFVFYDKEKSVFYCRFSYSFYYGNRNIDYIST